MPGAPPDEDLPLVRLAQAGDLEAFDTLVLRYQGAMTALLYRFAPGRADLEDLVQETFVRAWRGLSSWQPEKPFLHWLKRIAVNVGLDFCRSCKRSPSTLAIDDSTQLLENLADTKEPRNEAQTSLEEVQFLLSQVSADDRALLTLLYLNEMPVAEIAQQFGWSRANTKIKCFRARQRLRAVLTRHGYSVA